MQFSQIIDLTIFARATRGRPNVLLHYYTLTFLTIIVKL